MRVVRVAEDAPHTRALPRKNMNRFVIMLIGFIAIVAGCDDFGFGPGPGDFEAKLCGNYYLERLSAHEVRISFIKQNIGSLIIPSKVVQVGHDQRFILAKQNQLKQNPHNRVMEPAPGVFSYWIVDVTTPKLYGPLTEMQFLKIRKELEVPNVIDLKNINSYRK